MLVHPNGLQPQPTTAGKGAGGGQTALKPSRLPKPQPAWRTHCRELAQPGGGCKAPLPPRLPGAPHRAGGPGKGPGLGAQRRGYCGFCGERERMGLSPGGSRGAPHAWSRLPVGGRNGKALAEGKSEEAWLVIGELFFSHPHGGRFHPTSEAAFPAPYPFLSCPEAPETKTSYLPAPASASCSAEPRWSPPNTPTHTHDLPDSVQPTRSRSPFRALRATEHLPFVLPEDDPFPPFPPFPRFGPGIGPTLPSLHPPAGCTPQGPWRSPLLRPALGCAQRGRRPGAGRGGQGGGAQGIGASSAMCLFSFPP